MSNRRRIDLRKLAAAMTRTVEQQVAERDDEQSRSVEQGEDRPPAGNYPQ